MIPFYRNKYLFRTKQSIYKGTMYYYIGNYIKLPQGEVRFIFTVTKRHSDYFEIEWRKFV